MKGCMIIQFLDITVFLLGHEDEIILVLQAFILKCLAELQLGSIHLISVFAFFLSSQFLRSIC